MGRALFVRRGALGDTLLMTAVLRAWRRVLPAGTELVLAGVQEHVVLLQHAGVVDAACSSEAFASWAPERLRAQLVGFEHVLADDPGFVTAGPPGARAYDPTPRTDEPLTVQIAAQLDLRLAWPQDQYLALPTTVGTPTLATQHAPVVLAPGSGGAAKCWPAQRWLELAARLQPQGFPLAVLVGPVEQERQDPRGWCWPVPVAFLVPRDTIELARAIAEARLFVGNDSGPTHLAAMSSATTVALFGPSDHRVFGPIGPRAHLLRAPGGELARLDVDEVARLCGDVLCR